MALLLALLPAPARAASFGDIEVQAVRTPGGQPSHGYSEFVFEVKNRGSRARTVELTLPGNLYGGPRENGLRAINRKVTVGPGEAALVSLLQPNTPEVPGSGLGVTLDGRKQDGGLTVEPVRGRSNYGQSHGYSRRRRYHHMSRGSSAGSTGPLLLVSKGLSEAAFPTDVLANLGHGRSDQVQLVRNSQPLTAWSANWLAYSRYDGIAVTPQDLRPGQADAVVQALWQYVEAGGVLLVLGPGQFPMPGTRQRDTSPLDLPPMPQRGGLGMEGRAIGRPGAPPAGVEQDIEERPAPEPGPLVAPPSVERYPVGFGLCLVNKEPTAKWDSGVAELFYSQMSLTAAPWQGAHGLMHYNMSFPVVEDLGVPVRGLFALIILFGVVIGPVNLMLLARSNRRIWMLWTVPAISLVFCLMVLGYMVVAEGWQGHSRVAGVTALDENTLRATTLGRAAFYSPLTPGDGLRFSEATEVTVQGEEHSAFSNHCTLDWVAAGESSDGGQHLSRGWVTARVPAHFAVRKSEPQRRERVTVAREADGGLTMVNGLGVNVQTILLADENGVLYKAGPVGPGARAAMQKTAHPAVPARAVPRLRRLYHANTDWLTDGRTFQSGAHEYLTRRSYFAVVDSSPFLEQPLRGAAEKPCPSYVFGLMAEK